MRVLFSKVVAAAGITALAGIAQAFTLQMTGDSSPLGQQVESSTCQIGQESAFTTNAGDTVYTDEQSYSGNRALKMTIKEGSKGYGTWGGVIRLENCSDFGARRLYKGDELWIRTRIFVPEGFEFYQNGRNKFLRLRAFHDDNGKKVSEGYNDLYINSDLTQSNYSPFHFIFEGEPQWYNMGSQDHFFEENKWRTVEFYLKLDDKKQSEGGDSRVRVWVDGELIGDTGERATLKHANSYIEFFYLFTWWGNEGAHQTQSLYVDDLVVTTDQPTTVDAKGNKFIGVGEVSTRSVPNPPSSLVIK